jgi:hypothetical protein
VSSAARAAWARHLLWPGAWRQHRAQPRCQQIAMGSQSGRPRTPTSVLPRVPPPLPRPPAGASSCCPATTPARLLPHPQAGGGDHPPHQALHRRRGQAGREAQPARRRADSAGGRPRRLEPGGGWHVQHGRRERRGGRVRGQAARAGGGRRVCARQADDTQPGAGAGGGGAARARSLSRGPAPPGSCLPPLCWRGARCPARPARTWQLFDAALPAVRPRL